MEIEVKGHSGCQIDIVRDGNQLFVEKSTRDFSYLSRLVKQAEKQRKASVQEYQHIRVPQIYHIEKKPDLVSIKMEYVYSKNFIEYFESAGFEQISYFIKALILFIEKELESSFLQPVKASVLQDKFEDVNKKVLANSLLNQDIEVLGLLGQSAKIFNDLKEMILPVGTCHGDLTFSNMLFNGNNYYLIDFLDSFVESPLMDVVKLRQDSAFLWSQLMYIHHYDKLRLIIVCKKIDQEIDAYFSKQDWYKQNYTIFQLMNFLRILQYAKEEAVIVYLKKIIKQLCHEF